MEVCVVIRKGKWSNLTLSTVRFDANGQVLATPHVICDTWREGWQQAQEQGYTRLLLVDSGLVFTDIELFLDRLNNYPHKGLIGHITDPLDDTPYYLHPQTTYIDCEQLDINDLDKLDMLFPRPERSLKNIHHDYTPLWLQPGQGPAIKQQSELFGAKLIAKQLTLYDLVSNWNDSMRSLKQYLYDDDLAQQWISAQERVFTIAENHLWVLNNEPTTTGQGTIVSPASGLFWIRNLFSSKVDKVILMDISQTQIDFVNTLLSEWNGLDYGNFCEQYMYKNKIRHFNLDNPNLTNEDKVKLLKEKTFSKYVNDRIDFDTTRWNQVKHKVVKIENGDLVKNFPQLIKDISGPINLWASNILDYKYTLVKNTAEDYDNFLSSIKDNKVTMI